MAVLRLRVLGPVEILVDGRVVAAGPPQQCAVLAALAVDAGRSVPVETLVDRVWGVTPPEKVRRTLHTHITRIRRLLEWSGVDSDRVPVMRQSGGYLLDIDPDQVDLQRFRRLLDDAREPGRPQERKALLLREALELWRGQPLAGVQGQWAARMRETWQHQRVDAVVAWAHAELEMGNPATVIGTLTDLVDENPLMESLTAMLMRALHAAGRNAHALDRYTAIQGRLVEELGVDPGGDLQKLHQSILRGDVDQPVAAVAPPAKPAQLPMEVPGFTGRADELARLDALLSEVDRRATAVVVSTLSGTAGIGKTALAVHWAHRVADRFPDGQLYINLRGFDPSGAPTTPEETLRGFLDAFEIPASRIPATLQGKVGLYRTLLSGRRVLIVLDNARDADQVRPLLPGAPGCLAVITSRNQLSGLVAAEGAHPISLDLLSPDECRDLLAGRIGAEQVAAEENAVEDIIAACARLPLALAIVAARAAIHAGYPLAILGKELHDTRGSLEAFAGDDPATDVRTVFSWSYRALSPAAARLFRLMSIHPGTEITAPAAASLAGIALPQLQPLLAELTRIHLVTEPAPGRYALHDLLRAYATEQAHTHDSAPERRAATHRMLDHYLHTAYAADRICHPHRRTLSLTPPLPEVTLMEFADRSHALAWPSTEHRTLRSCVELAWAAGFDNHTWQLTQTLAIFFDWHGHWQAALEMHRTALRAAQRLADRPVEADLHRNIAVICARLGRLADHRHHLGRAQDLYRELADQLGEARCQFDLAVLLEKQGHYGEALGHFEESLRAFQAAQHDAWQARALNGVGWCHANLGDYPQALAFCGQALALHRRTEDFAGMAEAHNSLGYVHHRLGQYAEAIASYQQSLDLTRKTGSRPSQADTLAQLGDTLHATGDYPAARIAWQQALEILDDLGHADAQQIRAKIGALR